jgi:hypothetical protein
MWDVDRVCYFGCIFWWSWVLLLFFKSFNSCAEILVLWSKTCCMAKIQQNNNIQLPPEHFLSMKDVYPMSTYRGPLGGPFIFWKFPQLGPHNILTWWMTTATVHISSDQASPTQRFGSDDRTYIRMKDEPPIPTKKNKYYLYLESPQWLDTRMSQLHEEKTRPPSSNHATPLPRRGLGLEACYNPAGSQPRILLHFFSLSHIGCMFTQTGEMFFYWFGCFLGKDKEQEWERKGQKCTL